MLASRQAVRQIVSKVKTNEVLKKSLVAKRFFHQEGQRSFRRNAGAGWGIAAVATAVVVAAAASNAKTVNAEAKPVDYSAVRGAIADILDVEDYDDGSYGPLFVRLAWHSAGSYSKKDGDGGSNGALIRHLPESGWAGNKGLDIAVKLLEKVKRQFPGISYGDLYTLAGVVAVEEMGGPKIPWRPGRLDHTDGSKSPKQDNRLPDASQGCPHLRDVFYRMGFNDQEIVALSGAHALGRCHTTRSGYDGPWTRAPTTFSNEYYKLLLSEIWTVRKWNGPRQFENSKSGSDLMMLPSDMALLDDPKMKQWVEKYANDEKAFFDDFSSAFGKLLELGVSFHAHDEPPSLWRRIFG